MKSTDLRSELRLRRGLALGFLMILATMAMLFRSFSWSQIEQGLAAGPSCALRFWTGLQCAFCGMTHSWIAIFKGEWRQSFQYNILGVPTLLTAVSWGVSTALVVDSQRAPWLWNGRWSRAGVGTALGVLFAYAIFRNFPSSQ
jgi:hypothetical protein